MSYPNLTVIYCGVKDSIPLNTVLLVQVLRYRLYLLDFLVSDNFWMINFHQGTLMLYLKKEHYSGGGGYLTLEQLAVTFTPTMPDVVKVVSFIPPSL